MLRRERVVVDRSEELHVGRERHQVVPLVLERPAHRQAVDRAVARRDDLHRAVLEVAVVVVVGVAEQAFVVRPVVFGAERVVDGDEAAAGAHVLAQVDLALVEVGARRGVDGQRGIDGAAMRPKRIAAVAREDHGLVGVSRQRAELRHVFGVVDGDAFGAEPGDERVLQHVAGDERRVQAGGELRPEVGVPGPGRAREQQDLVLPRRCRPVVIAARVDAAAHVVVHVPAVGRRTRGQVAVRGVLDLGAGPSDRGGEAQQGRGVTTKASLLHVCAPSR